MKDGGKYYIIKCLNDYEETATRLRREEMVRQKKNNAFYGTYQTYRDQIELVGDPQLWQGLSISESPQVTADFFGIFERVCRSQG